MNVKWAEIFAKLFLLLNTNVLEILISKHDNTSFSDQQSQLILFLIIQLR